MLKNYFRIAWRNLVHNKAYAIINVLGLGVGIACALVIFLVVSRERGYDRDQPNYNRIYRVVTSKMHAEGATYNQGVPFPMRDALRVSFPQFEKVIAVYSQGGAQVGVPDPGGREPARRFKEPENRIFFTEPGFFDMFRFNWIAGAPAGLDEPNTSALSKSTARKYFGSWENALGRLVSVEGVMMKVTGIFEDPPDNTDFPLHVVISLETFPQLIPSYINYGLDDWGGVSSTNQCYVMSAAPLDVEHFNTQLFPPFAEKHQNNSKTKVQYSLQPLSDIHFNERFSGGFSQQVVSRKTLWTLIITGLFVLTVAAINFINLATAQGIRRMKEVGVKKAIGANRFQLTGQFFMEALLMTLLSVAAAVVLTRAGVPLINRYLELNISLGSAGASRLVFFLVILTLLLSFISGCYPALVLSRYRPAFALKNKFNNLKAGGIRLRSSLVVVQFIIAQALIFGTLVMASQMKLFRQSDLGFDQDAVLNMEIPGDSLQRSRLETFRQQLMNVPEVAGVSFSSQAPSSENNWSTNFRFENKEPDFHISLLWADPEFFTVYRPEIIAGRAIQPSDTLREFVINETLVRKLGFDNPKEAVGKRMKLGGGQGGQMYPVVGVIKDFHLHPLTQEITPFVISTYADYRYMANIRINPARTERSLQKIEAVWNQLFPGHLFTYTLLKDDINDFYQQEERLTRLFRVFCAITLLISCLGVYGLAMFMVAQRTKEVGVRKVLGATPASIVILFSRNFLWLTLIAFVVAAPLTWWMMEQWLQEFPYRITIGERIVGTTLFAALVVTLFTVSFHAVRTALMNPVKSLRSE